MSEVPLYQTREKRASAETRVPDQTRPGKPRSRTKSLFPGPEFVLALARILRLVVLIQAVEKDDFIPLY